MAQQSFEEVLPEENKTHRLPICFIVPHEITCKSETERGSASVGYKDNLTMNRKYSSSRPCPAIPASTSAQ